MLCTSLEKASQAMIRLGGLKVRWFDRWHPDLDEALKAIPEMATCPHELYRLLMQNSGPARKRTVLVSKNGIPIAVVGLRQREGHTWEPVTQWIVPGAVAPASPGSVVPALESLGVDLRVAWWRMGEPPHESRSSHCAETTPTYRLRVDGDYEGFWRQSSTHKTVRKSRNRCSEFAVAVNAPGAAEWAIINAEAKWRSANGGADPALSDRILVANYLEARKMRFTLSLMDRGEIIGAISLVRHECDLAATVIYRKPEYHRHGIGDRLIDVSAAFAAESGYRELDLGGGHDYKERWAPQVGHRCFLRICPPAVALGERALYRARQPFVLARQLLRLTRRPSSPPTRTNSI